MSPARWPMVVTQVTKCMKGGEWGLQKIPQRNVAWYSQISFFPSRKFEIWIIFIMLSLCHEKKIIKKKYLGIKPTLPAGPIQPKEHQIAISVLVNFLGVDITLFQLCFKNHSPSPINKAQTANLALEDFPVVASTFPPSLPCTWPSICAGLIWCLVLHFILWNGFPCPPPLK